MAIGAPRIKAGRKAMELRHQRYFVAVAKELLFTRAAKWLAIKQPALSLHIRQLEREMDTPLFRRETLGVKLTGSGALLPDEVRRILDQVERTKAVVKTRARGETGHIPLGVAGATYVHRLVPGLVLTYLPRTLSPARRFRLVP